MSWINTAVDKLIAAATLVCLSPLLGAIALAIKLEGLFDPKARGPAVWAMTRISQGERFGLFKFRTFWAHRHPDDYDGLGPQNTSQQTNLDVTRVGHFLLKWYLDELPQLFNILRGDMRLVGPRPVPPWYYAEELSVGASAKRWVKAGWAGLAQASKGPRSSGYKSRRLDALYVRRVANMSSWQRLRYDLRVILRTLQTMLRGEGL
ncbi:sugar transferase [Nitrospinae bacterium AH_259_B05_G02_I21]|nr:sugar transferase [Nitrospinae bacterium AH_259_B05_G02_I21]MDA2932441.1 sugar transferase [Nitrospinae bacterium AH-259-F20]